MFKLNRRSFVAGAVAATSVGLYSPAIAQGKTIKIGAVQPFSGGLELYGNQAKLGLDLAAKEINDAGGIMGHMVELVYADNKTDPKTSVERANSLIRSDGVLALTGPITSNARDAMASTVKRLKTPLLYATNYEGGACDRYIFCYNTVPNQELAKLLPAMNSRFGKSYYMFGADYVWPQKMFEAAEKIVGGLGGSVAGKEFTPWGVKEFSPVIRKIKDSGAKVLVFALPGADGITFIKQADSFGLLNDVKVAFLGFAETYLGAFGADKGKDMWVTVPFASSQGTDGVKDFVARIKANGGEKAPISHYVMTHYNALMSVKAALEKSGKVDKEALVDGLEGLTVKTPTGDMSIGAKDHHVTLNMYLAKSATSQLEIVEELGSLAPESGCSA